MKPLRLLGLLLMIGVSSMPAFAGQKNAPSKSAPSDKEFQRLLELAKKGDADAQFNLGLMYDKGQGVPQDYAEAVKWYRKAAEQGYAKAQERLSLMYGLGLGLPRDNVESLKWLRKSAEQGVDTAQWSLGIMYYRGWGVPQDYAETAKWWRKCAERGNNIIYMLSIGEMYEKGQGVTQDYMEAHKWYNLAAAFSPDEGYTKEAISNRDRVAALMTPAQIAEAQKLAREWKPTE